MTQALSGKITHKKSTQAVVAASVGNALEWYDFSVFAFFATYIGHSFFIEGDETSSLIKTFLLFAVGFIARPLGAIYLGLYSDRVGRKAGLTMTIGLMAIGTFIIAVAPPVWVLGIGAPFLLLVGRLFQGFSAGGEIGGATAFLVESAPPSKRSMYASWLQASMGISNIIAALIGVMVTTLFTEPEIQQWAWRIPFVFGLLIVPVGYYIRRHLNETEAFEHQQQSRAFHDLPKFTFSMILAQYPRHLLAAFMLSILWTVSVYTLIIYMPTYYASQVAGLGFSKNNAFTASLIGNVFMVIGCILSGRMADKRGAHHVMFVGALVLALGGLPLLMILHHYPRLEVLVLIHACFCIMISIFCGVAPVVLASIFPVEVRSTGMSVAYNTAAIFFAGFTPALMTWATKAIHPLAPAGYLMFATIVALLGLNLASKLRREEASPRSKFNVEPVEVQ